MSSSLPCGTCGAELPAATAKFCMECGAPQAPAEPTAEVRKTVTLLFTDVSGSTTMGESLDPEALRTVMGRYFALAREAVERHGGVVEKFVGDAVLAVFGLPEVREDDAVRAVRAAADLRLAMAALAAELAETQGVRLAIRTGVNTGPVVTGADRAGGAFATGDAVNTAARLEQAAASGEVLLGHATYELVRDAVEAVEVEPVSAKGKAEPVRAYRLLAVDGAAAGRSRHLDAPLVGREREARALEDALERTVELGRGHLVTVTGGPGIGKTRLVADFLDRADARATVLRGRCVSYGRGVTYFPLVQILRDGAGLTGTESPEVVRHAVASVLTDLTLGERLTDLLLPLLGAGGEPGSAEDTHEAVTRFLEQVALRRPVVLQVDDLHWAEPALLDLLDRVREETADLPLLLVGQARPELLETRPTWGQGATNAVTIGLEPFDTDAVDASLAALLGPGVPPAVSEAVLRWSGGNPLFVEEIVTHLRETGMLAADGDGWIVTGDLEAAGVPATVSALLAARLERLPARERAALQAVSVVGLELTGPEAVALAGPEAATMLASLARRDLLRRVRGAGGDSWAFRHLLIREAAYDALPKAERSRLHTLLADHLLDDPSLAGGEHWAFVAHHRLQAAKYAAELAPHAAATAGLADAAAAAAIQAAEQAIVEQEAIPRLLREALTLPLGTAVRRRLLLSLQTLLEGLYLHDEVPPVLDDLEASFAEAGATALERRTLEMSRIALAVSQSEEVDPERLRVLAEEVRAAAEGAGDSLRLQLALLALATCHAMAARWEPVLGMLREHTGTGKRSFDDFTRGWEMAAVFHGPRHVAELADKARAARDAALLDQERIGHEMVLTVALVAQGDLDTLSRLDELLSRARIDTCRSTYRPIAAAAFELAGRLDDAAALLAESVARMADAGDVAHASTYHAMQALLRHERGADTDEVAAIVEQAAAWTSSYDVLSIALVEGGRALVALRRDDLEEARRCSETALAAVDRSDQVQWRATLRRLLASIPRALGDSEQERQLLLDAHALYASKGMVRWQAGIEDRVAELG